MVVLVQDLQQARQRDPRVVVHHHKPARVVAHVQRRGVPECGHEAVLSGQRLHGVLGVGPLAGAVVARRADAVPAVGRAIFDLLIAALAVRRMPGVHVLGSRDDESAGRRGWLVAIDVRHASHAVVMVRRAPRLVGNAQSIGQRARREHRDQQLPRLQRGTAAPAQRGGVWRLADDWREGVVVGEVVVGGCGRSGVRSGRESRLPSEHGTNALPTVGSAVSAVVAKCGGVCRVGECALSGPKLGQSEGAGRCVAASGTHTHTAPTPHPLTRLPVELSGGFAIAAPFPGEVKQHMTDLATVYAKQ